MKEDFFVGDDGLSVLPSLPNSQTSTVSSVDSLASIMEGGSLSMHLEVLCGYIRDHRSLSNAEILSASTYAQRSSMGVKHRFLLIHLHRVGKGDVWLRLDRLRSDEKSLAGFVIAGGEVQANDIVGSPACCCCSEFCVDLLYCFGRPQWLRTKICSLEKRNGRTLRRTDVLRYCLTFGTSCSSSCPSWSVTKLGRCVTLSIITRSPGSYICPSRRRTIVGCSVLHFNSTSERSDGVNTHLESHNTRNFHLMFVLRFEIAYYRNIPSSFMVCRPAFLSY